MCIPNNHGRHHTSSHRWWQQDDRTDSSDTEWFVYDDIPVAKWAFFIHEKFEGKMSFLIWVIDDCKLGVTRTWSLSRRIWKVLFISNCHYRLFLFLELKYECLGGYNIKTCYLCDTDLSWHPKKLTVHKKKDETILNPRDFTSLSRNVELYLHNLK